MNTVFIRIFFFCDIVSLTLFDNFRHVRRDFWAGSQVLTSLEGRTANRRAHTSSESSSGRTPPEQASDHKILLSNLLSTFLLLLECFFRISPDIRLNLTEPEWERIHVIFEQCGNTVYEFAESRCFFD